ncbi:MAG TPA: amino acid adenylation domain-containing protein [Polyangiaceae bacterium]|nr:amino acid adenylation domain-containing protein [Polyangiaceae bacterium]
MNDRARTALSKGPVMTSHPGSAADRSFRQKLLALPRAERAAQITRYLTEQIAGVMDTSVSRVDVKRPLVGLGLDSLMAVELTNALVSELGVQVSIAQFFRGMSLLDLSATVLDSLADEEVADGGIVPEAVPAETVGLLSYGQRALWFLNQLAPDSIAYHVVLAIRVRSPVLDPDAWRRALQGVVDRHAPLRTTYALREEEPVQRVHSSLPVTFRHVDAEPWSMTDFDARMLEDLRAPFDLSAGPVLRATLYARAPEDHVLAVAVHHIAIDFSSVMILAREVGLLYAAEQAGVSPELPPLRHEYADYVRHNREVVTAEAGERAWAYFRAHLDGELPVLALPTDRARPTVQTYRGGTHSFKIDAALTKAIVELARSRGVTLYTLLLAGYSTLLHRYSGQDDVCVGSPDNGRTRSAFEPLVGYFVNPIVVRSRFTDDPSFLELLDRVGASVASALEHREFPFSLLVERLAAGRDPSRAPLFQAAFSFHALTAEDEQLAPFVLGEPCVRVPLGGVEIESMRVEEGLAQVDMTLVTVAARGELSASLQYNVDLFDASTAERFAESLRALLRAVVRDPASPVSRFSVLSDEEKQRIVVEWNDTVVDHDPAPVHERFEAQARRTPEAVAVTFEGTSLTYAALDRRAKRVASVLRARGVRRGSFVAIASERSFEMLDGLLGILEAGAAYVPIDPALPAERVAFMLEDCAAAVLLTQRKHIPSLPAFDGDVIALDDLPAGGDEPAEASGATLDDPMYVIYTSGSTGKPKGTINTHRGVSNHLSWRQRMFSLGGDDAVLQKTPFIFDVAVWELFLPLVVGARLVLARPGGHKDSAYMLRTIADERITTVHFVPSMLQLFLDEPNLDACRALRRVMCGGEALTHDLQERFFTRLPLDLHLCYGPTETSIAVTYLRCSRDNLRRGIRIGRPIDNVQIHLLDRHMQPVPVGVVGEIHVGGMAVGAGYLGREELTREKFVPNPFRAGERLYKTGDLGRYLVDGSIEFIGRSDHQIKIRGYRVELGEVEHALREQRGVREAVVVAREDALGDKRLVGYVTLDDAASSPHELRQGTKAKLPEYMVPSTVVVLDRMPLTPTGKIDLRALPDAAGTGTAGTIISPRDAIELQLVQIWERLLERSPIGVTQDFFDLGGHSLLAVRLIGALRRELARELPLSAVFQAPTVEQLAAALRRESTTGPASPLVALQPHGGLAPFFCVHPSGGNVLCYHELARSLGSAQPFFGLQAEGVDDDREPIDDLVEMARRYVAAVRDRRPHGPYLLGGWSFGGVVAFEMARQLLEAGESVSGVALIDAPLPGALHREDDTHSFLLLARAQRISLDAKDLAGLDFESKLERLAAAVRRDGIAANDFGEGDLRRLLRVIRASARALETFTPSRVAAPLCILRAQERTDDTPFSASEGWRALSPSATIVEVPGDHHSLVTPPNVHTLARTLRRWFDELTAVASATVARSPAAH